MVSTKNQFMNKLLYCSTKVEIITLWDLNLSICLIKNKNLIKKKDLVKSKN